MKSLFFNEDAKEEIEPIKTVPVRWKTNYNNKMDCPSFVHIDYAPENIPLRSDLDTTVIEISTEDGSHSPIFKRVYDMVIFTAEYLNDAFVFSSHGITAMELFKVMAEKRSSFTLKSKVCIYFYTELKFKS